MKEFFTKTFTELTTSEPLEIHGLGDTSLTPGQISGLYSVINYRYENLLPTTTYTDKKMDEMYKAICNTPDCDILAYAIVGRLWVMGVIRPTMTTVLQ